MFIFEGFGKTINADRKVARAQRIAGARFNGTVAGGVLQKTSD